ncbi:hypothetical protein DFH07DRAFT_839322 [Mycena maculata]|uniref:BTB domain-containing protein n=1 Tax=Mycena maculata TaxID=230809 RepID=A0AAD7MZS3_9AGAR|nr:hypothetical protein DFH07DRAFT_839322 [Mycena maculata]
MDLSDTSITIETAPIRDEKYFFGDGDCVFLVRGILFKLHKWALCRDPDSMFRDMFDIPQDFQAKVLDPIALSDDIADFRALCWAVYALPMEIELQNKSGADLVRLTAVAKMSHKYTLVSFEAWALTLIRTHCQLTSGDHLDGCPQEMLCRIFEAAEKGGQQDLCDLVEETWLRRLKSGEFPLRHALDFGEEHNRRAFLGKAYYQQALVMKLLAAPIGTSGASDFSQSNLTHEQMYRLLSGHCSLSLA